MDGLINKYLSAKYRDGARGENGEYDCWGLARMARVELYGRQMLASRGGEYRYDPKGFTEHYRSQIAGMVEITDPVPGCVIAVLRKKVICMHVAVCVHDINNTGLGLHVLEINPGQNARLIPLYRFIESMKLRTIKFYDDKNLPVTA